MQKTKKNAKKKPAKKEKKKVSISKTNKKAHSARSKTVKRSKLSEYSHLKLEKFWQAKWEKEGTYKTSSDFKKKKMYVLDMFPYPSGQGLHVGHPRGYIGSDLYARMKRMEGYNVLHPMGYDAFGLPAEQYAITHKVHPKKAVEKNVATFEKQLSIIGLSYDWSRKVNTTDPEYYKWTQWIFLQIYNSWFDKSAQKARPIKDLIKIFEKSGNQKVGAACDEDAPSFDAKEWKGFSKIEKQNILMKYRLSYEGYAEVNWCKELGTVLANDEVVTGKNGELLSERGSYPVEKKPMRQWFMRITAYGDRLLEGHSKIDWSENIKEIQKNWIGRSEGSEVSFKIKDLDEYIKVFTTRLDTVFGVTYVVLAPEHPLVENLKKIAQNKKEIESYITKTSKKSEIDRMSDEKEKTGVELRGVKAINPADGSEVPVWIADYVLAHYGTGAVMAVPSHDKRDFEFAQKYELPMRQVIKGLDDSASVCFEDDGMLISSGRYTGMKSADARKALTKDLGGKLVVKYKMRDAIFARQRYWGEPIPLVHKKDGSIDEVPLPKLPLLLPNVKSYEPIGTGESPLAGVKSWVSAGYETNTMPGWAGSSWYFLRYIDPKNKKEFASKKALSYWFGKKGGGVDMYVGGAEHATGHLMYSRFWHKVLYDLGYVETDEPFRTLRNQGMIGGADGRKMSKRWGNVVNPDDVVKTYGADTLRLYEAFMGPFDQSLPWNTDSIVGPRRFLERVWKMADIDFGSKTSKGAMTVLHKTIKKVTEDIESFNFNTAVSSMMICLNEMEKAENVSLEDFKMFLQILAPFAPHMTEELWKHLGGKKSIHLSGWPKFDPKKIVADEIKIVVQVNGKVRGEMLVSKDEKEEDIKNMALRDENVLRFTEGKEPRRVIYVPGRLINIVI